jgi:hypothetical protein
MSEALKNALYDVVEKAKKYDAIIHLRKNGEIHCDFCGKCQCDVKKLVAGPRVFICDECIELCVEVIKEEKVNEEDK